MRLSRHPRPRWLAPIRRTPFLVALACVALAAALVTVGASDASASRTTQPDELGITEPGGASLSPRDVAALRDALKDPAVYPPVAVESRITAGRPTLSGQSPTIKVQIGDKVYEQNWNQQEASMECPTALWLLPIDRATLKVVGPANGTVASICGVGAPNLTKAVADLGDGGDDAPLVVVNSLSYGAGSHNFPDIVGPLEKLGFSNDLGRVQWNQTSLTGIGIPGSNAGEAWSVGGATSDDNGTPGPTPSSLSGTLLINAGDPARYGFNALAVEQATLGTNGDISVAGKTYTNSSTSGSGFHLVVVDRANPDLVIDNRSFGPDDYATLRQALDSVLQREDALILLASFGSPFASMPTSGLAVNALARPVYDLGGTPDEVFALKGGQQFAMAAVGRSPQLDGVVSPRAITSSPVRKEGTGAMTVQLALGKRGKWYAPVAASPSLAGSPFAFRQIVAQPARPWPYSAADSKATTEERNAFAWWQSELCQCPDLRANYVTGQATNAWATKLANESCPNVVMKPSESFSCTAWKEVQAQLHDEYDAYTHVAVFVTHNLTVFSAVKDDDSLGLTAAWQTVSAELKKDENIDLAAKQNGALAVKILGSVFSFGEAIPVFGEASSIFSGIFDTVAEFTDKPDGQDYTLDTTIAAMATSLVNQHAAQLTMLGNLLDMAFRDWDRMNAVAQHLSHEDPAWAWEDNFPGLFVIPVNRAAQAGFYQTLLAKFFEQIRTTNGESNDIMNWHHSGMHNFSRYTDPSQWLGMPSIMEGSSWDLAAIGEKPIASRVGGSEDRPIPLSTDLIQQLQQTIGVYLPDMYRQWPFRTTVIDSEQPTYSTRCWTDPMVCFVDYYSYILNPDS